MITSALGADGAVQIHNFGADTINVVVDVEGWYSSVSAAVPSGQDQTQQSIAVQASPLGAGAWATYKYRVGTTSSFANVPVADATDSGGSHPAAWPVTTSGGTFTAYTWNIRNTLIGVLGAAPDSLIQVEACYGTTSTATNLVCAMPSNVQFAQSAFGAGFATDGAGPGEIALLTGDYQVAATDAAVAGSLGGLSIGRSLTTLAPADAGVAPGSQRTDASGVFGPGWTAALNGPSAGDGSLKVADRSSSGVLFTGYLLFTAPDGGVATYQATSPVGTYPTSFAGVGNAVGDGTTVAKTSASTVTMADPDGTVTTWTLSNGVWKVSGIVQAGSNSTSTYTYTAAGLTTRILAPVPAGVSCTSAPDTTVGCRSITLTYQTLTVAGVNVTRLQTVTLSLPQTAGTSNLVAVANYDYTSGGLLADAYDPRISPHLTTAYSYNAAGRLATLTPPGQAAYSFGYDTSGRLSTVSRPDPSGSTATTTVVYNVSTSSGPVVLTAVATGTWDETGDLPVTGTAVFTATHVPAATPAAGDWPYATIHYLDVNGLEVNTAQYGAGTWQLDTTQYDSNGKDVWDLSAGNRAQALTPTSSTDPYVGDLTSNVARADLLASTSVANPLDPSETTDTYGPTHPVTLTDGSTIHARTHVATSYDEGAPTGGIDPITGASYDLPTTVVTDPYNVDTNADIGYPDAQRTHDGYAAINTGDVAGWTLYQPTTTTVQMAASASSADLVTTTRYDSSGRTIETRLPGGAAGGTAQSTLTTYYTPGSSGTCVSNLWPGMICSTAPAAQPGTGNPLPATSYTYNQYGQPLAKTETYGSSGTVRTTTAAYDTAGRVTSSAITVTPTTAGGAALPTVAHGYNTANGLPTTTSTTVSGTTTTLTTLYDTLARPTSYTDATGTASTMTYDLDGNLTSLNDGQGTTTYTHDSSTEHRHLVTSENIGVTGSPSTFTAIYDAAGNLATETYPNGLTATASYDNVQNAASLVYAASGSTWMSFTATHDDSDRVVSQTGPQSSQTNTYDQAGRLTAVQDTTASACTTRAYTFDADSNRTILHTYPPATGGACTTSTTPATTTTGYDQADRDTNTGYTYDTLGRTTTVPSIDAKGIASHSTTTGNLSLGYYTNDMANTQTQASTTLSFTLDPLQNRINTTSDGTTTTTNHYSNASDNPTTTTTTATATRNITGPDGTFAATANQSGIVTLQLPNLHGDIVATAADTTTATGTTDYSESTEYGTPRTAATAYGTYGWLGADQRSSGSLGGAILMGARLYETTTGRFLSVDPILGGNANAYIYPTDPVNHNDVSGQTNNVNGHVCHWYGYCDFRMSNARATTLADLINAGAGATALCALIAARSGGAGTIAALCGAISGILWTSSAWINYLVDRWHRGIFIRVFYCLIGSYIWHQ